MTVVKRTKMADPDRSQARRPLLFGQRSGTKVKLDGDDLPIMKESDVMGVLA
jgi:co-chaperonin GroES (HSP10)